MENKFTKGEWKVSYYTTAHLPYRYAINDKQETDDEVEANAKLIAASPLLLEACINALRDVKHLNAQLIKEGKHGYILMENELNDAINKATK